MSNDLDSIILKHALKNAFDYGKASPGSIAGKVIGEAPDAKADMKSLMKKISEIAAKVNSYSKDGLAREMGNFKYEMKVEKEKTISLPDAVEGKVVTRFPPEPNGFPHIGHAKAAWLDYEAARIYNGKFIMRFDDTNPEKEKQEYADAILYWLKWLGIPTGAPIFASDFMPQIIGYADKLVESGDAYVCQCAPETTKQLRFEGKECPCRQNPVGKNAELWSQLKGGSLARGTASLRIKADMQSQNTAMRDPSIFRSVTAPHYRQGEKYKAWPLYDFQAPILDSLNGVTHAMRTKEYELRDELYYYIISKLKLQKPLLVEFSRLSIKNAPISKRALAPLIAENKVMGWDDPRLPTLAGLCRRGIKPEAIKSFVLSFGISKVESEPGWDALLNENRKIIEPVAKHFYFVPKPVLLVIKGAPKARVSMPMHPRDKELGTREIDVHEEFYVPGADAEKVAVGEMARLKGHCNFRVLSKSDSGIVAEYGGFDTLPPLKVQWAAKESAVKCDVLRPLDLFNGEAFNPDSLETISGYVEGPAAGLAKTEPVQFERFGYCAFDGNDKGTARFIFISQ
ncbi:MAG TPA: glutamate--tRNA ligase [Candidatus Micrarchaeota archaeon]|nr:glutamate--tRNA ligase [Candidatus Micrarchaeota archaeon]